MIRPFDSLMVRTLVGPLAAAMQLFAIYVVVHGHYSPGGGFQGGVLLAASVILPQLVKGGEGPHHLSLRGAVSLTSAGVLIFAVVGLMAMLWGEPLLAYGALPIAADLADRHSLGILLIEVGVTIAVAGGMIAIFYGLTQPLGEET